MLATENYIAIHKLEACLVSLHVGSGDETLKLILRPIIQYEVNHKHAIARLFADCHKNS